MPDVLTPYKETYPITHADSSALWNDFLKGDKSAFAAIYTRYFHILFTYGKKLTDNTDLIQDCIQDLFIELLKSRENISPTTSVKYYLFKSLRRKISRKLTEAAGKTTRHSVFQEEHGEAEGTVELEWIHDQTVREQKEEILRALDLLTKKQKKAMLLKFYDNKSYPEIASIMSIGTDSVYNIISKATSFLRSNLKKVCVLLFVFF